MMKHTVLTSLVTLTLLIGCSQRSENTLTFDFPDSGVGTHHQDAGPPCEPTNLERVLTDFNNCGMCGSQCDVDRTDQCNNGFCQCGHGAACEEGSGCFEGRCLVADNTTPCDTVTDCPNETGHQECIDNPLYSQSYCVDTCEFTDQCPNGFACVVGACTRLECVPEVCDGIDNDCDGLVDENVDGSGPLSRWCLTDGDPTVEPLPPCRRGRQTCTVGGEWTMCEDEIAPAPESGILACNSRDDDCDGCVDGVLALDGTCTSETPNGFDVLYLIDVSGSMASYIAAVVDATERFSALYAGNPEFRFGIVAISGTGNTDYRAHVDLDFTDFTTFSLALATVLDSGLGGSEEPTWDAIYESATDTIAYALDTDGDGEADTMDESRTGLSWTPGSIRIMVLFGDETGQSNRNRRMLLDVTEATMCASMTHGESLTVFGRLSNRMDFDACATWHPLTTEPDVMFENLTEIIADPCL